RPGLGIVARHFHLHARGRPGISEPNDIKEPDNAVRRLPDHGVADRTERVVGNWFGIAPLGFTLLETRSEYSRFDRILPCTSVVNQIKVAVLQLGHTGGVLVRTGWNLWAEDAPDRQLAGRGDGGRHENYNRANERSHELRLRMSNRDHPRRFRQGPCHSLG